MFVKRETETSMADLLSQKVHSGTLNLKAPNKNAADDILFFMPPTSKKLRGHIGLGLSVCPSARLSVTPFVGCKTREPLELGT